MRIIEIKRRLIESRAKLGVGDTTLVIGAFKVGFLMRIRIIFKHQLATLIFEDVLAFNVVVVERLTLASVDLSGLVYYRSGLLGLALVSKAIWFFFKLLEHIRIYLARVICYGRIFFLRVPIKFALLGFFCSVGNF